MYCAKGFLTKFILLIKTNYWWFIKCYFKYNIFIIRQCYANSEKNLPKRVTYITCIVSLSIQNLFFINYYGTKAKIICMLLTICIFNFNKNKNKQREIPTCCCYKLHGVYIISGQRKPKNYIVKLFPTTVNTLSYVDSLSGQTMHCIDLLFRFL